MISIKYLKYCFETENSDFCKHNIINDQQLLTVLDMHINLVKRTGSNLVSAMGLLTEPHTLYIVMICPIKAVM